MADRSTSHAPPQIDEPIGACLGAGGFASVWELSRDRVLKVAHASHDLARARMEREAEALAAIGAPAVPHFAAHGVTADGRAWIAMERIAGATLDTLGVVPFAEALALADGALAALARVHAARFVHRDVKPSNLARTPSGRLVILDLGLARRLPDDPDDPTRANVQVGSLEYMPPEQLADAASVDERSDLYAIGCVLYALCAGRPPFTGDAAALERAHAALRPPRLGALAPVPAALEALVEDLLAKDRARRPPTADAVRARLAEVVRAAEPAERSTHAISMIGEGKQPVVLVWAELPKVDRALLATLSARRLVIVSQRGRRVLAGALGAEHGDPAGAALAAARELAAAGARVALHLDAMRVTASPRGQALHGDAADKPESWLPDREWTGVVLTRALASVVQAPTRGTEVGDGFRALAEDGGGDVELVGRDALLTDLAADAAAAFAGGPAFAVIVGDAGVGKTAFAGELARRLAGQAVRVCRAALPTPGSGRSASAVVAELVGAAATDLRGLGDGLRAAARAQPTAVILDDLHHADHELLDALEYATLGGEALPLWVLGIASPRLDARRPQLGARAHRHRRDVLPPLAEDAAVALAAALLRPAEYPPLRALRRLAAIARGNPLHLAMLARELHDRGAVRERPGGAPFLDATALDAIEPTALGPWLAARELAPLAPELVALARVCAVLGGELGRADLAAILAAAERSGSATTTIDVDVGLGELVRAGLLADTARGVHFRQALVEEGVYATTDERERTALHAAALAYWQARPDAAERVARHAEALGARDVAADAYAALAAHADREHRIIDAEIAWSSALAHGNAGDDRYARALVGRGRARYKLQRVRDALADLDAALAIARAHSNAELEVRALVEQATALDWADAYDKSAEAGERAATRLAEYPVPDVQLDVDLARARTLFRRQQLADAVAPLRDVMLRARAAGRGEVETIAALLLAPTLVMTGDLDGAERAFAELFVACERWGDRFHLGAAYANRAFLQSERGEIDRMADDLEHVVQVARELGHAALERIGTYNLAENRLWQGALASALALAQRSLAIQLAHAEGSSQLDRILVARVHAARGDRGALQTALAALAGEALGDDDALLVAALTAVADERPDRWPDVLARIDRLPVHPRLELVHLAVRAGCVSAADRERFRAIAAADAVWSRRLDAL